MNKQRAQGIMDHLVASIDKELLGWKHSDRVMTETGIRTTWKKDLNMLSIFVMFEENEEAIIACLTGPETVDRRQFRNISSKSGEMATDAIVRFASHLRRKEDN